MVTKSALAVIAQYIHITWKVYVFVGSGRPSGRPNELFFSILIQNLDSNLMWTYIYVNDITNSVH